MKLVNLQTGLPEEVDDASAQAALQARTHGLDPTQTVPVKDTWGNIKQVPAAEVEGAIGKGGSIAGAEEARKADLEERHGGIGGQLAAGAEGAVRGLTVGISDPLAIEAARAWGGDEAANAVRTHLDEEKEAHPTLSTVGEVAGAVVPALLSGGESAAIEAPELLGTAERVASAAKPSLLSTIARSTPSGLTARLGSSVERATAEVLGSPAASSALGRIAKAAASSAASGSVEGAIYSAGGQLSEDALGDHEVTAQKFMAALGHGFIWGAVLGGAAGGGAKGVEEAAKPLLRRVAPHLEAKAGETAWEALGGTERTAKEAADVGGTKAVGQTVLDKTGLHEGSLARAAIASEEVAPRLDAAIAKQREAIDTILQTHGAKPGEVQIPDLAGIRHLRANGGLDAIDLQARKFAVPEATREELKQLAIDHERLLIAKQVNAQSIEATAAAKAANPASGLPFTMGAAWTAAHAAMLGHIPGAVSILAASAGRKLMNERGQMLAAVTLSKIARMDLIARAVNAVDQDLSHAAGTLVGRAGKPRATRWTGPGREATPQAKIQHALDQNDKTMITAKHIEAILPGLKSQAPRVTSAALRALNTGAIYLTVARPPRLDRPTLADPRPTPRMSSVAAEEHYERVRAVHDPVGTLAEGVENGTLTSLQVEAIAGGGSARVLDAFKAKVIDELSKPHPPLTDAKIRVLQTLFQGQGDALSSPDVSSMIHHAYDKAPSGAPAQAAVTPTSMPRGSKPVKGFSSGGKLKNEQTHADATGG